MDSSRLLHSEILACLGSLIIIFGNHYQMICVFIALFLESEAQELGSIGVTVIVITYYENQQQMLPSYMTLLAWSFNDMCAAL